MKIFCYQVFITHTSFQRHHDYSNISGYAIANTEQEFIGFMLEKYSESTTNDFEWMEIEPEFDDFGVFEVSRDKVYQGWRD